MSSHPTNPAPIVFRGLQGRTLADQERALARGYTNMHTYAIDELANMLHELTQRVDRIEADLQDLTGRQLDQ